MVELKTRETNASVEDFIIALADDRRQEESRTVDAMMRRVTGHPPKMWGPSIVGYGRYHYRYDSGREGSLFLTGFAPRKQAFTLYIMPGFGQYGELMGRLGKHKTGKSCLYLTRLASVDLAVLEDLVRHSVDFMTRKYGA